MKRSLITVIITLAAALLPAAAAHAAITFDASSSKIFGGATTVTSTITVGSTTNEMLIIGIAASGTQATAVNVDGDAATRATVASTSGQSADIWYYPMLSAGSHTVSSTLGASASGTMIVASYLGIASTSPVDVSSKASGNSKTPSSSITTVSANDLIVDVVAFPGSDSFSAVGGGQSLVAATGSAYEKGQSSYKVAAIAGATTTSWTITASSVNWQEVQAAFKQAPLTYTWTNASGTNNWSTPGNWSGGAVPGSGNIAIFSASSTASSSINTTVNVAGIQIVSGYTGTITQASGNAITVGTSSWVQAAGTFKGSTGSDAITVNGTLQLSGGTFTGTNGMMQIAGSSTVSGGTFNSASGTVAFIATGTTAVASGSITLYNMQMGSGVASNVSLAIATGTTITVQNYLYGDTNSSTVQYLGGGTINVQGNIEAGKQSRSATGTATIALTGIGIQFIGDDAAAGNGSTTDMLVLPNLTIQKTTGIAYFEGSSTVTGAVSVNQGELGLSTTTSAVSVRINGALTIASSARLSDYANVTSTVTLSSVTNNGMVWFDGNPLTCTSTPPNYVVLNSTSSSQVPWSGSGKFLLRYTAASNQGGSVVDSNGTNTTNNAWTFPTTSVAFLVQSTSSQVSNATSVTATFPFYPRANDLVIVVASYRTHSPNYYQISDTAGNTYVQVAASAFGGFGGAIMAYARGINTTSTFSVTIPTPDNTPGPMSLGIFEYTEMAPSSTFDTQGFHAALWPSAFTGTVTGSHNNELYFAAMAYDISTSTAAVSSTSGWGSELALTDNTTFQNLYVQDFASSTPLTTNASWTPNPAGNLDFVAIAAVFTSPYVSSGYAASGTIDSATFDTKSASGAQLNSVTWYGSTLGGSQVGFQFAVSNSAGGPWNYKGPSGDNSLYFGLTTGAGVPISLVSTSTSVGYSQFSGYRYFRYRIELLSGSSGATTPVVTAVNVNWSP